MVWLGLGSNIGNRLFHIQNAISSLRNSIDRIVQAPLYETAPQDYFNQNYFLNTVIKGQTKLIPLDLLLRIQEIERQGGRMRIGIPRKGPRTIDIDILLWDDLVLRTGSKFLETPSQIENELIIPHPSMEKRLFVLKPLLDLDPDIVDPRDGIPYHVKASHIIDQPVKLYREE